MSRLLLGLLVFIDVLVGLWWFLGREDEPAPKSAAEQVTEARLGRFPRSQFLIEHDRFLPATDPRTVPAGEAAWLRPDDEVFGVLVQGQARAYPIPMISYHHVVNDVVRGIPIAVTY